MLEIERTLDIDATPEKAWAVLGRFMHIDQFHPRISKVDVLSEAQTGTGARRRCHFKDGSSVVEEVIDWQEGRSYRAQLSGFSMPLNTAIARLAVEPLGEGRARLSMGMQYEVKYGPIGWVLGKTMMANMMGKLFMVVLKGLEERVVTGKAPSA
jgi:carbon monoxide dehydrogenase subunit G